MRKLNSESQILIKASNRVQMFEMHVTNRRQRIGFTIQSSLREVTLSIIIMVATSNHNTVLEQTNNYDPMTFIFSPDNSLG